MKIFLMGAGYVGMMVLKSLSSQGHELYVSTTKPEKINSLTPFAREVILIDTSHEKRLQEVVNFCDVLIVLIAANTSATYRETYLNTALSLSAMLKERSHPFHLIYSSSTSVYENCTSKEVSEEMILQPSSEASQILYDTERVFLQFPGTCVIRLGGIYGPGRELSVRAARMAGKAMSGNGAEITNHVHVEDILEAIQFCLNHRLTGIYNLVNEAHPSRKELYDPLCQAQGLSLPVWDLNTESLRNYLVLNAKIKQAGFVFKQPTLDD